METMSYLSSHHSDDISEIDLELSQDPLQVDRVSPSWASDSSAESEELSEDEHSEAQEDEDGLESALGSPAQMSSLSMAREDGSVVEEDHLSGIATEVPGEGQRAVSSIAAGTLLRLPAAEAVTSDVVSLYHSESASGLSAIQMPVPTRAGLPFGGQLASLMTPEEKHVDQGVSAGYSDIGASYIHQATSPVHEAEPASSPSLAATFVDKEIDSTQPEPLDPVREDKSVATFPDEDRQERSIDTDLTQGREEKLVDAIPDSVYEEKLVDAIPDSVYEEKLVDAIPDSVYEEKVWIQDRRPQEEAVDTTPRTFKRRSRSMWTQCSRPTKKRL
ncbi:hypothetical protein BC629DRAFT_267545 [Irpex lacteus]|nr:hypothetical protein BC629DRAFT_267545 [Irpex lacteus]